MVTDAVMVDLQVLDRPATDALTADTPDTPDVREAPDVPAPDAPDVALPSDATPVDVVDVPPADALGDASADASDVPSDAAVDARDVPTDVAVCVEGWRQCNGAVLEICQGGRWIAEPECANAARAPGAQARCYANACFFVCRTDACVANGGGAGHEGVCRTDADCATNSMAVPDTTGESLSFGNGRCEGGFCAFRVGRVHCPAADAGATCYDLQPTIPRTVFPEYNGCNAPTFERGRCGAGFGQACTSEFDCPRSHRCDLATEAATRYCVPR